MIGHVAVLTAEQGCVVLLQGKTNFALFFSLVRLPRFRVGDCTRCAFTIQGFKVIPNTNIAGGMAPRRCLRLEVESCGLQALCVCVFV